MPHAFFRIPARDGEQESERLNAFLRSHRVLTTNQQFVVDGANSFWAFSIDYQDSSHSENEPGNAGRHGSGRRIDYKDILPPDQFAVFAKLREVRKEIAEAEGVPLFTVFTNEQLAEIARRNCRTMADLKKIEGIGEARAGKHGKRVFEALQMNGCANTDS